MLDKARRLWKKKLNEALVFVTGTIRFEGPKKVS
jgi:putative sterol carrier protein